MADQILNITREADWLTLELNRPNARNALSRDLIHSFIAELKVAAQDESIRGITLRGAGEVFCAGGDLRGFQTLNAKRESSLEDIRTASRETGKLLRTVATQPQPTIALVHGAAMAGGLGLMAAVDIAIAHSDTRLALTETRLGLIPAQIAPWIVRRGGMIAAQRLMLTGARFTADQAREFGLVDFVEADDAHLHERHEAIRRDIRACAPGANRATKRLMRTLEGDVLDDFVEQAADAFAQALAGDEAQQGIRSFLDRSKPSWQSR
ncbi:MAG: enoyl-CoA hydratase-related protein [Pseudomonadota bacterium]